jgi:hypothetical protein
MGGVLYVGAAGVEGQVIQSGSGSRIFRDIQIVLAMEIPNEAIQMAKEIRGEWQGVECGRVMTSEDLNCLVEEMPRERVSLNWISEHIQGRSAELVLAILGLLAMLPIVSGPIAFLILAPAVGLILARPDLPFPDQITDWQFPSRPVRRLIGTAAFASSWWDKHARLSWAGAFPGMRRVAGFFIVLLVPMLLIPLPFSNVLPGFAIAALAFACLERDSLLFAVSTGLGAFTIALNIFAALSLGGSLLRSI